MTDDNLSSLSPSGRMKFYADEMNAFIEKRLPDDGKDTTGLTKAMRYSLTAGGKRIRPALMLEFCRITSNSTASYKRAMHYALAIEMIHTYSLIHDDLPCMDNDDLRRGKPTNHKVFGEATAMLAGDALLTEAFSEAAYTVTEYPLDSEQAVKAVKCLADCAGRLGMCGGQQTDLLLEESREKPSEEEILKMYLGKTSALLEAACACGCIANKRYDLVPEAREFAKNYGLAFQITDDILDVVGDTKKLGKTVGSDAANDKNTYLKAVGMEKAREAARQYAEKAKKAVERFKENDMLLFLCDSVLNRDF